MLGGAVINEDGKWNGTWAPLSPPSGGGQFKLTVPAATAAIVRLVAN